MMKNAPTVTRGEHAKIIRAAYGRSIEAIFDLGKALIAAKEDLPHGEFTEMIRRDLPFGERQAQRLMSIAANQVLANTTYMSYLKPSVTLLYELSRLEPDELAPVFKRMGRHKDDDPEMLIGKLLIHKDMLRAIGQPDGSASEELEAITGGQADQEQSLEPAELAPESAEFEEVENGSVKFPEPTQTPQTPQTSRADRAKGFAATLGKILASDSLAASLDVFVHTAKMLDKDEDISAYALIVYELDALVDRAKAFSEELLPMKVRQEQGDRKPHGLH